MTPPGRLLYLGNVVVDLVLRVPALPERGGDVLASAARLTPGGGFNVMAAAARQGMPVAYGGVLGTGPLAELARAALAAEGVEAPIPPRRGLDTGLVVCAVEPGGERTFLTSPAAEATLTRADLACVDARPGDTVCLSGYGLAHPANRAALLGWLDDLDESVVVVLDPGPLAGRLLSAALARVLARTDWLTCNEREARLLAGRTGRAAAGTPPVGLARALCGLLRRTGGVLVRTGPRGCLLACCATSSVPVQSPGFAVEVADTNGAGDTHTGVFIAGLAAGLDAGEATRRANAAAAISVTRSGPATGPDRAELAAFLAGRWRAGGGDG